MSRVDGPTDGSPDLQKVARESPDAVRHVADRAADAGDTELAEWLFRVLDEEDGNAGR